MPPDRRFEVTFAPKLIAVLALTVASMSALAQAQALIRCSIDGRVIYQSTVCVGKTEIVGARPKQPFTGTQAAAEPTAPRPPSKSLAAALRRRAEEDKATPKLAENTGSGLSVLRERMGAL